MNQLLELFFFFKRHNMVWRDDDFPHTVHPDGRSEWTFFLTAASDCEHSEHVDAHVVPFSHHLSPGKPEAGPLPFFLSSVCLFLLCAAF